LPAPMVIRLVLWAQSAGELGEAAVFHSIIYPSRLNDWKGVGSRHSLGLKVQSVPWVMPACIGSSAFALPADVLPREATTGQEH
jgi:hypothetical protein